MAGPSSVEQPPQSGEENAPDAAIGIKRPADEDKNDDEEGAKRKAAKSENNAFTGGCHCGLVKYTAKFDAADLQASKCNCTFCQKLGITNLSLPDADFTLVSPTSKDEVEHYAPKTKSAEAGNSDARRYFCTSCGVHVWSEGWYKFGDERHDFFAINIATIDQPQEGVDLSEAKISYWDGLHDNWYAGKESKPWPGGLL